MIRTRPMKVFSLYILSFFLTQTLNAEVIDIDINRLKVLMTAGIVVIDVRTPREWQHTGIVENSIPIMFFDEKRRPHTQQWLQQASSYSAPENELILICRTGNRSKIIASYLSKQHGYKRVYNVAGGIKHWLRQGNQTVAPN